VDEQVKQLARLARLELTAEERARIGGQLDDILAYIRCLEQVDVEAIEPSLFVGGGGRTRPPGLRIEGAAGHATDDAPDAAGGVFRVPRVIG